MKTKITKKQIKAELVRALESGQSVIVCGTEYRQCGRSIFQYQDGKHVMSFRKGWFTNDLVDKLYNQMKGAK